MEIERANDDRSPSKIREKNTKKRESEEVFENLHNENHREKDEKFRRPLYKVRVSFSLFCCYMIDSTTRQIEFNI